MCQIFVMGVPRNHPLSKNDIIECWEKVHLSLKNIPMTYDISAPYGILYSKKSSKSAIRFIELLKTFI